VPAKGADTVRAHPEEESERENFPAQLASGGREVLSPRFASEVERLRSRPGRTLVGCAGEGSAPPATGADWCGQKQAARALRWLRSRGVHTVKKELWMRTNGASFGLRFRSAEQCALCAACPGPRKTVASPAMRSVRSSARPFSFVGRLGAAGLGGPLLRCSRAALIASRRACAQSGRSRSLRSARRSALKSGARGILRRGSFALRARVVFLFTCGVHGVIWLALARIINGAGVPRPQAGAGAKRNPRKRGPTARRESASPPTVFHRG